MVVTLSIIVITIDVSFTILSVKADMYSGFWVATHKLIKNSNGVIYFVIFFLKSN